MNFNKQENKGSKNYNIFQLSKDSYGGNIIPSDVDLEKSVLGAIMIEENAFSIVANILAANVFYLDIHQEIYKAIVTLFNESKPIDLRTVIDQLRKNGVLEKVGGAYYLASMTTQVNATSNIEYYARILIELSMRRSLISTVSALQTEAYDPTNDIFDLLDNAEQKLFEITNNSIKKGYEPMDTLLLNAIKNIELSKNKKSGIIGIPSGFNALDKCTLGWQKSDLVIIAARPGMGKTAFILSAIRNAAIDFKKSIAFFSLEMSSLQIVNRLIAIETEIENERIKRGDLENYEWETLMTRTSDLSQTNIFIDDTPSISIFELRTKCRRLKIKQNIDLIVVDYLQLMNGDSIKRATNREQEIASISRALKNLAKELDVSVIALSQLSRAVESRGGNKKPQLSDLRESGSIEQDSDMVLLLYRPEYYGILENENGSSTKGSAELIIAKHRNGALKTINLAYVSKYTKFVNADCLNENVNNHFYDRTVIHSSKINSL